MLRTLERGSLLIVLAALVGLGFWLGSRDSRLREAIDEQGKALEDAEQRLGVEEATSKAHAEQIAENRAAIAELRTKDAARVEEIAGLGERARGLEERLGRAEGDLAKQAALAEELAEVRERLGALERLGEADARRLADLERRLEGLEDERARESLRIDRLEKALGIEP